MKVLQVGYEFNHSFSFKQEDVIRFAQATGDFNPIHLNEEYASNTLFKKPIIHGFLSGSVFSKVFGTIYPGEGTIYLEQTMEFKKPMYVDNEYRAHFKVVQVEPTQGLLVIECRISSSAGKNCIEGMAKLMNKEIFNLQDKAQ